MIRKHHRLSACFFLLAIAFGQTPANAQVEELFEVFGDKKTEKAEKDVNAEEEKPPAIPPGDEMEVAAEIIAVEWEGQADVEFEVMQVQLGGQAGNLDFLKPLINHEISFAKRACSPTKEQLQQIVQAATKAHAAMRDMVNRNNQRVIVNGQQQVHFNGPNGEQMHGNPYDRVRKDASKYLKTILPAEKFEQYAAQSKARIAYERSVTVSIAMDLLDRRVGLLEEQREPIRQVLEEELKLDMSMMSIYLYNPQFSPAWPNKVLAKLTKLQKKALSNGQNVFNSMHIGHEAQLGLGEEWLK